MPSELPRFTAAETEVPAFRAQARAEDAVVGAPLLAMEHAEERAVRTAHLDGLA